MRFTPLLLALLPITAAAQDDDTRVQVTNTFIAAYNADDGDAIDNDDYGFLLNKLVLRGSAGSMDAEVRVDGFGVIERPDDSYQSDGSLERIGVRFRLGDWTLEAGDRHVELGRGIVLSLRPIEGAGVDIAFRGGQVGYRGDVNEFSLFAGVTNTVNVDAVTEKYIRDVEDIVVGGRYAARLGDTELAVFASHLQIEEDQSKGLIAGGAMVDPVVEDHTSSFGASFEAPALAEWIAFYLEGDFQRRLVLGEAEHATAGYATIDLSFLDTQVLIAGLYLDEWLVTGSTHSSLQTKFVYYRPPTLERIDQEVFNNTHVAGGRLRIERPLGTDDVVGHVNGMYRLENPGDPNEEQVVHGYAGLEMYLPSRLALSGGYRITEAGDLEANAATGALATERPGDKTMIHFEVDYTQPVGAAYELHLVNNSEHRTRKSEITTRYWRGDLLLSLDKARLGGITFNFGYDTENDETPNFFYAGIVHWRITDAWDLRATGGTQRGGIKCIGGVCREFPIFAGGRMEVVARY